MAFLITVLVIAPGMVVLAALCLEAHDRMKGEQRGVRRDAL